MHNQVIESEKETIEKKYCIYLWILGSLYSYFSDIKIKINAIKNKKNEVIKNKLFAKMEPIIKDIVPIIEKIFILSFFNSSL